MKSKPFFFQNVNQDSGCDNSCDGVVMLNISENHGQMWLLFWTYQTPLCHSPNRGHGPLFKTLAKTLI